MLEVCWCMRGSSHLAFHQHGHVNEHVMEFADAVFQFDDLSVSGFDLVQGLLGHLRVHLDLRRHGSVWTRRYTTRSDSGG